MSKREIGKRKGTISLSIANEVLGRAQELASVQNRSLSNYVESVLRAADPRKCEHDWQIDRENDLIKCVKCGEENDG